MRLLAWRRVPRESPRSGYFRKFRMCLVSSPACEECSRNAAARRFELACSSKAMVLMAARIVRENSADQHGAQETAAIRDFCKSWIVLHGGWIHRLRGV